MSESIQNKCVHSLFSKNLATQLLRARVIRLSPRCIITCSGRPREALVWTMFRSERV